MVWPTIDLHTNESKSILKKIDQMGSSDRDKLNSRGWEYANQLIENKKYD